MSFCTAFSNELIKLAAGKSYPISRLLSTGLARFVGSRGLMGRLKAGTVTQQDMRAIRRILVTSKKLPFKKADLMARRIISSSKAGKFAGGKKYPVSRYLTSRAAQAGTAGTATAAATGLLVHPAVAAGLAGKEALQSGLVTQIGRAAGPRALAGRIARGKKLYKSEKELLKMISPTMRQRVGITGEKLKGKTKLLAKKLKKKMRKK